MTVIVGSIDRENQRMWIGSDALLSGDDETYASRNHKVFRKGGFLFGHTGSLRANQLIRYGSGMPRLTAARKKDLMQFMCNHVVRHMIDLLNKGGWGTIANGYLETDDNFMVMIGGRLFIVWSDFQVFEPEQDFFAIGSGARISLGSMVASEGMAEEDRVDLAIEAASVFSGSVGGKRTVISKKF